MTSSTDEISRVEWLRGDVLVIANPAAGGVDDELIQAVCRRFPIGSTHLEWTQRAGDAARIAAAFAAHSARPLEPSLLSVGTAALPRSAPHWRPVPPSRRQSWWYRPAAEIPPPATSGASSTGGRCSTSRRSPTAARSRPQDLLHLVEPDRAVMLGASTGFLAQVLIEARGVDPTIKGFNRYVMASGAVLQAMPAHQPESSSTACSSGRDRRRR